MSTDVSDLPRDIRAWPRPEPARLGMTDTTTVDRHLAHKQSTEQVFINDVARDGEMLIALGELPRMHRFFNESAIPRHDTLMLAEFVRQGVEVIAHGLLTVPLGSQFVLRSVELEIVDPEATVIADGSSPAVVALPVNQVRRNRAGAAYAATGPVYCSIGGRPAARFGGMVGFLARDTYDDLRAESGKARLGVPSGSVVASDPSTVGRQLRENVLIGQLAGLPREALCRVVPRPHPAFFDRPLDHYPGMMIAEAARQLAAVSVSSDARVPVTSVYTGYAAMDFVSFAELDTLVSLNVVGWTDLDNGAELTIAARQGDRITTTCVFRMYYDGWGGWSS